MSCNGGAAGFCPSSGPWDWGYGDCIADCEAACHTSAMPHTSSSPAWQELSPVCQTLCSGQQAGDQVGAPCSPVYCYCGEGEDFSMQCGAGQGWCQYNTTAGQCLSDCAGNCEGGSHSSTPPPTPPPTSPPSCDSLCAGAEEGVEAGARCSPHYCYCASNESWELSCEAGETFCPATATCIPYCEADCDTPAP